MEFAKQEELLGDLHGYIAAKVSEDLRAKGQSPTGAEIKASNIIRDMYLVDKSSLGSLTYGLYLEVSKETKNIRGYIYNESISFATAWYAKLSLENSDTIWIPMDLFADAVRDFSEHSDENERNADANNTLSGLVDNFLDTDYLKLL